MYPNLRSWQTLRRATSPTSTVLWFVFPIPFLRATLFIPEKSADQSRSLYASFLQSMGTQYSPEKIKGKRRPNLMTGKVSEANLQMEDLEP